MKLRLVLGAAVAILRGLGAIPSTVGLAPVPQPSRGYLLVGNAGPFVHVGAYRCWVRAKLGEPSHILPGGIWLYDDRTVEGGGLHGTLVVLFRDEKVWDLRLISALAGATWVASAKPPSALAAAP